MLLMCGACNSSSEAVAGENMPLSGSAAPGSERNKLYVTVQRVQPRTCPSERCGDVGRTGFRQTRDPLERRDGWVRITKFYDANCAGGRTRYVVAGNARFEATNGIVDSRFAEWVPAAALSSNRPPDPAEKATVGECIVALPDDFAQYHATFARVVHRLIGEVRCTAGDFTAQGGWMKSVNEYKNDPVYIHLLWRHDDQEPYLHECGDESGVVESQRRSG
jgi:hypothetical protein